MVLLPLIGMVYAMAVFGYLYIQAFIIAGIAINRENAKRNFEKTLSEEKSAQATCSDRGKN